MPGDEYASVGGGALKLKGGKIQKSKKKKKDNEKEKEKISSGIERSLATTTTTTSEEDATKSKELDIRKDAERQEQEEEEAAMAVDYKTEAERRHEEAMRKKMLRMLDDPTKASELRKTHKERVEGFNTYLSKLSEHHDMPKIGPG